MEKHGTTFKIKPNAETRVGEQGQSPTQTPTFSEVGDPFFQSGLIYVQGAGGLILRNTDDVASDKPKRRSA
jgi:hypothetical protein